MPDKPEHENAKGKTKKRLYKRPWFYVTVIVAVCAIAFGGFGISRLMQDDPEPPPTKDEHVELSVNSPAYAWLESVQSDETKSDGGGDLKVNRTDPLVPDVTCSVLKSAPDESLATSQISLDGNEMTVQILAPGTSGKVFSSIAKDSGSCWPKVVEAKDGDGYRYIEAGEGYLAQIGDTLVYLPKGDEAGAKKAFDRVSASITKAGCLNTTVKESDYTRNAKISKDNYTGLMKSETVESTIPLDLLPTVTVPELIELDDPDAEEPAGPLDPSIPSMPDEVTKPTFDDQPEIQKEPFTSEARYQVADVEGPGCGWGWTDWELPSETDKQLAQSKIDGLKKAQEAANAEANAYLNKQANWSAGRLTDAHDADTWNAYAEEFNAATKKWDWLEKKRSEIKPKWDKYVEDHNYWNDFEQLKEDAETKYDEDSQNCRDAQKEQEDWDSRYDSTSGDSGSGSGIPERPKGCDEEPKKPAILDKERPKEPLPPKMDEGVTIPDEWDQPK